jgi:hypothetical protein
MTKPFELYSEKHGPVVAVIADPWQNLQKPTLKELGLYNRPMLVTADGTLWKYNGGRWEHTSYSIVESMQIAMEET